MNKIMSIAVLLTAMTALGGCGGSSGRDALWEKIDRLQTQKNELQSRADKLETENQQLLDQCHSLDSIDPALRLSALDRLDRIEIGSYTRLIDDNKDGTLDTLAVYITPIDQAEDTVKAPGQVRVQLWHLDEAAPQPLVGEWTVSPEQLKTCWGHALTSRYYRLKFDLPQSLGDKTDDLTLKVEFTDYLTGKHLKAQTPIAAQ